MLKIKSLLFASLFFCSSLVQAVTLELEVKNECSGGFVARISCKNEYILKGTPYAKSEFFTIAQMEPGEDCSLFNLWDALAFGSILVDKVRVVIPKKADPDATLKAVVVFQNRSTLNACVPTVRQLFAQ